MRFDTYAFQEPWYGFYCCSVTQSFDKVGFLSEKNFLRRIVVSNLFLTLVIAFVVIVIAIACLAIGWLFTGKTKIERGACGRDPTQKAGHKDDCGTSMTCGICENREEKKEQSIDHKQDNP